jgi:hypothetical protein
MLTIPKSMMVCFCGICFLGPFHALHVYAETMAKYEGQSERTADRPSQLKMKERLGETRPSDLLHMEGGNNLVKDPNGREPRLILDPSTPKIGSVKLRDSIDGK